MPCRPLLLSWGLQIIFIDPETQPKFSSTFLTLHPHQTPAAHPIMSARLGRVKSHFQKSALLTKWLACAILQWCVCVCVSDGDSAPAGEASRDPERPLTAPSTRACQRFGLVAVEWWLLPSSPHPRANTHHHNGWMRAGQPAGACPPEEEGSFHRIDTLMAARLHAVGQQDQSHPGVKLVHHSPSRR